MNYTNLIIIIVEDSNLDVTYLLRTFRDYKITNEIKVFSNGEEALDYIKENERHFLVLVDMCLPGMHGIEFIKELKKLNRPQEITYLAISHELEIIERFKVNLEGAIAFLPKPICKERLIAIIEGMEIVFKKWEVQVV